MLFNLEKCSVMHMGKRDQELSYEIGGKVLKVSEEESGKKNHKMIQGYKDLSYEERLIRCGLTTLEKRRSRQRRLNRSL